MKLVLSIGLQGGYRRENCLNFFRGGGDSQDKSTRYLPCEEGELIIAAIEVPRCYSFSIKIQYYIVQ
jgi:hypothetical protein